MKTIDRILAIAQKEWRLNLRFATEFLIHNLIAPIKSALLMYLIYAGFLKGSQSLGVITQDNFLVYVLLGTMLHSQFSSAVSIFKNKLVTEKWWQTATATLLTPASTFEMIIGYVIGSGGVTILLNMLILIVITNFTTLPFQFIWLGMLMVLQTALLGFGIGLIGGTISLCWEGKSFIFEYILQALTFLSCFYYPIEILPKQLHSIVKYIPTFNIANLLHSLYLNGYSSHIILKVLYLTFSCIGVLIFSAFIFNRSMRRHGVVGY